MQRRATMTRSSGSATRAKMNAPVVFLVCCVVGSALGYNVRREAPYNIGPNDPYSVAVNPNYGQEPSQRLFWGDQGSNQVGGTGLWATLTNKFPILGSMFGRMELPTEYGVPNRYNVPQQFGAPNQYVSSQFGSPNRYELSPQYGAPGFQQPTFNQVPQYYQQVSQQSQQFRPRFAPSGRDVGLTDDAVIVTPPFVPVNEPVPIPAPAPAPIPVAPVPAPEPSPGYQYNKPQYRLEYPRK